LLFKRAYHGWAPEFSLNFEGAPADGLAHVRRLPWNDAEALDAMPLQEAETIAAIVLNPLEQSPGLITLAPSAAFIAAIERFRHRTGALIIVDDVRAGFRIHPQGSHKSMGLMPDMLCLGKTLGNGHSVAAVMGQADLWDSAERIVYTSTYIFSAVAFRAAITMLDIYERDHAFDRIMGAGERLIEGILASARRCGRDAAFSGPPSHPTLRFANDENGAVIAAFCREAATRGALFHPRLNWFLSAAHDDATIDEAISIVDASLHALV
jgi:glutamate-1-semialdehyde 2,1-aminomutase